LNSSIVTHYSWMYSIALIEEAAGPGLLCRTQDSELRTQNSELRTQNSELRTHLVCFRIQSDIASRAAGEIVSLISAYSLGAPVLDV